MMQQSALSMAMQPQLRSPTPAGAPLILSGPRMPHTLSPTQTHPGLMNGAGAPPPLVSPTEAGLFYSYDPYGLAASPFLEYQTHAHAHAAAIDQSTVGTSYVR